MSRTPRPLNFEWLIRELHRVGWKRYNEWKNPEAGGRIDVQWLWHPRTKYESLPRNVLVLGVKRNRNRPEWAEWQVEYSCRNAQREHVHLKWVDSFYGKPDIQRSLEIHRLMHRLAEVDIDKLPPTWQEGEPQFDPKIDS
jgi:hypothetical protein